MFAQSRLASWLFARYSTCARSQAICAMAKGERAKATAMLVPISMREVAAAAGAKLAALPENFAFMGAHEADKLALAEPDGGGPIQDFLAQTARELGIAESTVKTHLSRVYAKLGVRLFYLGGPNFRGYNINQVIPQDLRNQSQAPVLTYRTNATRLEPLRVTASHEGGVSIRGWNRKYTRLVACRYAVSREMTTSPSCRRGRASSRGRPTLPWPASRSPTALSSATGSTTPSATATCAASARSPRTSTRSRPAGQAPQITRVCTQHAVLPCVPA